jgi:hypothetical protein
MTNGPKGATLYVGMTGDIRRRVWQHKNKSVTGCFIYPDAAISREKGDQGMAPKQEA